MSEVPEQDRKKVQRQNLGCIFFVLLIIVVGIIWYNNRSGTSDTTVTTTTTTTQNQTVVQQDPYQVIETTFDGNPEKEKVQPMLEAVMERYKMSVTNDNILRVSNMLFVLKKESKVGVTEMEILKHIYQKGSSAIDLPTQAALSSSYLEQTK